VLSTLTPMLGRKGRILKPALIALLLLAGPAAVLVSWQRSERSSSPPAGTFHAEGLESRAIYSSPQSPGYTSWVGAWEMNDGSLMTGFVQATGEVDPADRELAPKGVIDAYGVPRGEPQRDFWGLDQTVEYLRSTDGGSTWEALRSDAFKAPSPYGYTAQATIGLKDGTLLRRVNGDDLRHESQIPHTAFLQRLAPGAERWTEPQVLMDPARRTYQLSRLRYLTDGRLIATGNYWDVPADTPLPERAKVPSTFLLMVSSDGGQTWRNGLTIPSETAPLPGNEWDTAELPNGDLAAVFRTRVSPSVDATQVRKVAVLEQNGDGWVLTGLRDAPFAPSGHPELLRTREGPILHIATTGVHYTTDGLNWKPLDFVPKRSYRSDYYPQAVQTRDGVIRVFGHVGGDDAYGERDQSITMDTFRIKADD